MSTCNDCGAHIVMPHDCRQEGSIAKLLTKVESMEKGQDEMKSDIKDLVSCIKGNGDSRGIIARLATIKTHVKLQWAALAALLGAWGSKLLSIW